MRLAFQISETSFKLYLLCSQSLLEAGAERAAALSQQGTSKSRVRSSEFIYTRKMLKISELPAPERGPVNIMILQTPTDIKGPLECLISNKHNFSDIFHVEV
jgi:hypothetical protein